MYYIIILMVKRIENDSIVIGLFNSCICMFIQNKPSGFNDTTESTKQVFIRMNTCQNEYLSFPVIILLVYDRPYVYV